MGLLHNSKALNKWMLEPYEDRLNDKAVDLTNNSFLNLEAKRFERILSCATATNVVHYAFSKCFFK